jgi:predicted Ser/Thr protein kinase
VQPAPAVRAKTNDVAGIRRNLWLEKYNVEHEELSNYDKFIIINRVI